MKTCRPQYTGSCRKHEKYLSSVTRQVMWNYFNHIITFYINFSRHEHQLDVLCIVQNLRFSGFSLHPLAFFLYSPFNIGSVQDVQNKTSKNKTPNDKSPNPKINVQLALKYSMAKELTLCHKLWFSIPYISLTQCRRP